MAKPHEFDMAMLSHIQIVWIAVDQKLRGN
jgi:hypothetical protein